MINDCAPNIGDVIEDNPGANGAIVLAKYRRSMCNDQAAYYVACLLPNNTATPYVVWTLIANADRYETMWGRYCYTLPELGAIWAEKTGAMQYE